MVRLHQRIVGVSMNLVLLLGVVVYMALITSIGLWLTKKGVRTLEDFLIAGKRLGTLIAGGTMIATWFGSGTVIGGPASLGYLYGLGPALRSCLCHP